MKKNVSICVLFIVLLGWSSKGNCQKDVIDNYNVTWKEKSKIASDAMPLGNGKTGALVSVIENGHIWVSVRHIDAWSEAHRLLKLGDIEIEITPNPFDIEFEQKLVMSQATVYLKGANGFESKIWIDANNEVIHLENNSKKEFQVNVKLHSWRNKPKIIIETNLKGIPGGVEESADVIVNNDTNALIWYHRNSTTKAFDWTIKALEIEKPKKLHNVLENRTFGAAVSGENMTSISKTEIESNFQKENHLKIHTSNQQVENVNTWLEDLKVNTGNKLNLKKNWKNHENWWSNFWDSSFIQISGSKDAETTSAGYAYTMYLNAMAGEGEFPIIWNGSMFAPNLSEVPQRNHTGFKYFKDPDYRSWGNLMLHQNVRLPYYSMNAAGQFDFTQPFLDVYTRGFQLMKDHTKAVFGHEGTVIRESTTLWGVIAPGVYGIKREGLEPGQQASEWHRTHWNAGLEVAWYMSEHYDYTQNEKFAKDTFIPFANEIVKFFDVHWQHRDGKLYFPDIHVLETFRRADNPMPIVAGLRCVLQRLLELPQYMTTASERKYWTDVLSRVPEIPTRVRNGKTILANAMVINSKKVNVEVAELYSVFPYHLYGVGLPELEMAQETYKNRTTLVNDVGGKNPEWAPGHIRGGWHPESIMAAMVGLTDSVQKEVIWALHRPVPEQRFPGFFKSTHDGTPDVQHSSVAATALQRMILQDVNDKIVIMPAWPKDWNCNFKLYAKKNTIVEGTVIDGELTDLEVSPKVRNKDVLIGQDLKIPDNSVWK